MSTLEYGWLWPHIIAMALCSARLLPIAFLCPLLGGNSTPTMVKLGLVLSLSASLHWAGGVDVPAAVVGTWAVGGAVLKEFLFGVSVGLVAALPFDAARMGGRFVDLFRGSSAESSLPSAGTKESATGDGLYQLLIALAVTSFAFPSVMSGIFKCFGVVRLGQFVPTEGAALYVVQLAGTSLGTGLAVGAPIAGAVMAVDCLLAMASRFAPQMNLQDAGTPLRILGGGAVLWLGLGVLSERLLSALVDVPGQLGTLLEVAR